MNRFLGFFVSMFFMCEAGLAQISEQTKILLDHHLNFVHRSSTSPSGFKGRQDTSIILCNGHDPAFSPDGERIAYSHGKIWTIDVTGKNRKKIGQLTHEIGPSWSPDGKKIVFQCYGKSRPRKDIFQIWVMNSDGSEPHPLLDTSIAPLGRAQHARWSPDGKQIVFTHGNQLWIVDTSGQNARPLTKDPAKEYEYVGDWSPDGKLIAYLREERSSEYKIWLIRPDGNDQRMLLGGISAIGAKWSKDGKFLYYSAGSAVWKIPTDGESPAKKVFDSDLDQPLLHFDISNDERWITYDDSGSGIIYHSIYLKRLNQDGMQKEGDR